MKEKEESFWGNILFWTWNLEDRFINYLADMCGGTPRVTMRYLGAYSINLK
jgi:hypothetical protein